MRHFPRYIIALIVFMIVIVSCGVAPRDKALSILKEGIKDKSDIIRINAAKALIETGDKEGYEVLYKILQDGDNDAIVAALGALYTLKEQTYSPVLAKLSKNSEPLVRTEAVHLITLSSDTGYKSILTEGINDRIARVRRYSYQGLANLNDARPIMNGLKDDDPLVRISAAKSLGMLGNDQAKNFIKKEMIPRIQILKSGHRQFLALLNWGIHRQFHTLKNF